MPCFGSADSKWVTGAFFVSADSEEVSKRRAERGREDFDWKGVSPAPGVFRKSGKQRGYA